MVFFKPSFRYLLTKAHLIMDFTTWIFWIVMLPTVICLHITDLFIQSDNIKRSISKYSLLLLSLNLLFFAGEITLFIFIIVTIFAYFICRTFQDSSMKKKNFILVLLIPILLIPLGYYKYAHFVCNDLFNQNWDTLKNVIIPIGISFYTFQTIAFCIDTLKRNQRVPGFVDYMNFCSFFPQIVAGPIERKDSLLPQVQNFSWTFKSHHYVQGIPYIILGLFFKMFLADNLAQSISHGYIGDNAFQVWTNNICFGFRIYFDFAGYGLTAYGIAKCLGVNITMNFLSPYTSNNISTFWRNWHISLTQWFRDYIYFAMKGSRTRFWWFNIIFMFLVSGIWHGAGWNFIIWGTLGGVTMVIHRIFKNTNLKLPSFIAWALTFVTMMFIWMFFYETDMLIVFKNLETILSISSYNIDAYLHLLSTNVSKSAHAIVFLPLAFAIIGLELISIKKHSHPYKIFTTPSFCMLMIILICMFHNTNSSQFIYFEF